MARYVGPAAARQSVGSRTALRPVRSFEGAAELAEDVKNRFATNQALLSRGNNRLEAVRYGELLVDVGQMKVDGPFR